MNPETPRGRKNSVKRVAFRESRARIGLGAQFPNFQCRTTHGLLAWVRVSVLRLNPSKMGGGPFVFFMKILKTGTFKNKDKSQRMGQRLIPSELFVAFFVFDDGSKDVNLGLTVEQEGNMLFATCRRPNLGPLPCEATHSLGPALYTSDCPRKRTVRRIASSTILRPVGLDLAFLRHPPKWLRFSFWFSFKTPTKLVPSKRQPHFFLIWVWVKIKPPGDRRF